MELDVQAGMDENGKAGGAGDGSGGAYYALLSLIPAAAALAVVFWLHSHRATVRMDAFGKKNKERIIA